MDISGILGLPTARLQPFVTTERRPIAGVLRCILLQRDEPSRGLGAQDWSGAERGWERGALI